MSISSIVVRGFGSFANGLLATLGFGQPQPVGPGVCGECAAFTGIGFDGTSLGESAIGHSLEVGAIGSVVFSGAQDGGLVPVDASGVEYV